VEEEYYIEVEEKDKPEKPKKSEKPKKEKSKEMILEYDESIIGGLPEDYRPIADEPEYDEVPLIESLSWFDYDVQLRETFSQIMQRTYNLNKNVTKLRMRAKASSRQVADFLIWFLRLNKQQYFAELISSLVRFSYHVDGV